MNQQENRKILIIDDNLENIKIVGSILRENRYQVGFTTGAKETLALLHDGIAGFDLILLDVNMPEMSGFEVCRILKHDPVSKQIPVIFLTANHDHDHLMEGFESGGQDYVTKPFIPAELLARIKTHLELKDSRDQLKQMNLILEEKVRERTAELEAANKELRKLDENKSEFLSLISHEINTPLNGIVGFTYLLRDSIDSPKLFELLNMLTESVNRLLEFSRQGLYITSLRTKPERFEKKLIRISQPLENALERFAAEISRKNIQINIRSQTGTDQIIANEELLELAFSGILSNSVIHAPDNSTIEIKTKNDQAYIKIRISDQGDGFSEAAMKKLFSPFSPGVKNMDKRKGLGLYLVKLVADFHGGDVSACNLKNNGAAVDLKIPRANT